MDKTRVLVADDHAVLRAGLRVLVAAQPDMEVVGEAADGFEAPKMARATKPDVVIFDISMPGPDFPETMAQLTSACPQTRILVLTVHDDAAYMRSALRAGASGYVVKTATDSELMAAIRAVRSGWTSVYPTHLAETPTAPTVGSAVARLSPREVQVLRLVAQGLTNQQIADRIHISVKTVETYRERVCAKLNLHDRAELFRFAVTEGLLAVNGTE